MEHKQINIIIGRFQPMTKGHIKLIEYAWDKLKIPTIIAMINTKDEKVDKKHPFPSSMLLPLYRNMFKGNKKVEDIILVKNANIVEIGDTLYNKGYQISSWTCGTDRLDSYSKMAERYKVQAHLSDNFQMLEVHRTDEDISATRVRQAILDDDYKSYKKLTPRLKLNSYLNGEDITYKILRGQLLKVYK